jgi:hypothetical protein
MNGNRDVDPISLSLNFILQVLKDSWLGCIATNSESLNDVRIGQQEGLLYINGQLQNIPQSAIIPEDEMERIFNSLAVKFPSTLDKFKLNTHIL